MTDALDPVRGARGAFDELAAWLPYRRRYGSVPAARLFCLPFAGGGASTFLAWRDAVPDWLEVCPLQLPGRDQRINERPLRRAAELAVQLIAALQPLLDRPFAFFGHSMGGLVGYEVTRVLRRDGERLPIGLFVSGTHPPHAPSQQPPRHQLNDADLLQHLRALGGTPDAFFRDPALRDLFLPTLRADLELAETYDAEAHEPLPVPITAFYGRSDRFVGADEVREWARYTSSGLRVHAFDAGHFFIRDAQDGVVAAVIEDIDCWRRNGSANPIRKEEHNGVRG
jgi:medium-chain acyl-[acyl-carrier-protein] hydrolase